MYKPDQRKIAVSVLTRAGWLSGTFHVPTKNAMVDYLNRQVEFLRMTDVALQGRADAIPFLALHRSAMMLLVPPGSERTLEQASGGSALELKPVTCLFESGILEGRIGVHAGIRVSDFFQNRHGFVLIEDCRLLLKSSTGDPVPAVKEARIVINTTWVLGVSDGTSEHPPVAEPLPATD